MKNFKKYSHIENSYQKEYISKVLANCGNDAVYVAQEKVDGTNFQFIVGRNESGVVEVSCGKRSGELAPDENFYRWQSIAAVMQAKIINLFEILETKYDCTEGVNINGELAGGHYPGMKSTEGAVLTRIAYSPEHFFYGFDIYIPTVGYLSPLDSIKLFNDSEIFCAENLHIGTLEELLNLDPAFPSTIATRLGYDAIEGNNAEGYVIKPIVPSYFGNGERIIIKHKNPKFKEVQKERKVPKVIVPGSDEFASLAAIIPDYINEARLVNCRSHLGETELPKDFGKILGEYAKDVFQEMITDDDNNKAIYEKLERIEQKRLNNEINKQCASNIKAVYLSL